MEKLKVMNSQMGLSPARAAPTAIPVNPISVMGVSMTLFSPNLSRSPLETYCQWREEAIEHLSSSKLSGRHTHLVSTIVAGHFLSKDKDLVICLHLLFHGLVQGLSDGELIHSRSLLWHQVSHGELDICMEHRTEKDREIGPIL
jgi:hypothetical protein